jgi:hypothetical protein
MTKHYMERKQNIDRLFEIVRTMNADEETISIFAKYLCVVVCGLLETAIREIYSDYAQNKANKNVANYVSAQLRRFHSPKTNNILALTECFSEEWKAKLESAISGEARDALDSIVNNRHNIAHGVDVGVTYGRIKDYYSKSIGIIQLIERQCAG